MLSLALGIGATTAIFSQLNAILFSSIPGIGAGLKRFPAEFTATDVQPLSAALGDTPAGERKAAALTGTFGALALVLAAAGMYSLLACVAGRRTREIGIRMGLGATRAGVLGLVLRRGSPVSTAGTAAGLAAASALTRFVASFPHGVSPTDAATFGGVAAVLIDVAPGRRRARLAGGADQR